MPSVTDIINLMEEAAPSRLAESWDNAGLQSGSRDWPVNKIWVALDPLPEVVSAACSHNVDLLITHHPLLFKPVHCIDFNSSIGSIIEKSAVARLAIYSAHTNLDKVSGGLNDMLANRLELDETKVLVPTSDSESCKLVFYVPADHEHKVLTALFQTPAGIIGQYSCCSFRNSGKGSFLPGNRTSPFIGHPGEVTHVDETRIETVVRKKDISSVISHVRAHHPYQTMAFDIYPLINAEKKNGFGRIGKLKERMTLIQFARTVKQRLSLSSVKITGNEDMALNSAAICSGSGASLLDAFFASNAEVFISGDFRYHDARAAEEKGRALIDIGHFPSEQIMITEITDYLRRQILNNSWNIQVEACLLEKNPFNMI